MLNSICGIFVTWVMLVMLSHSGISEFRGIDHKVGGLVKEVAVTAVHLIDGGYNRPVISRNWLADALVDSSRR